MECICLDLRIKCSSRFESIFSVFSNKYLRKLHFRKPRYSQKSSLSLLLALLTYWLTTALIIVCKVYSLFNLFRQLAICDDFKPVLRSFILLTRNRVQNLVHHYVIIPYKLIQGKCVSNSGKV